MRLSSWSVGFIERSGEALPLDLPYHPNARGEVNSYGDASAICQPLESGTFRLLRVHDDLENGLLQCSFQHANLPSKASDLLFVAISYTWSSHDRFWYGTHDSSPKPMILDGAKVIISDKVANILSLMRQTKRSLIWIDALCINQSDNAEKSIQVPQMHLIYGFASEVCVVLGSPQSRIDQFLDSVNSGIAPDIVTRYVNDMTTAERKSWRKSFGWRGFDKLSRNIYWRRAWVLQELLLGTKITLFSGTRNVDFADLCGFVECLRQIFEYRMSKNDLEAFFAFAVRNNTKDSLVWLAWAKSTKSLPILNLSGLELLRATRAWNQCRDPRDVLYSKLAMAADIREVIRQPDYELQLSSVFQDFATDYIKRYRNLEHIAFATSTRNKLSLPSWVPEWTSRDKDWHPWTARSKIPAIVYPEISRPPRVSDDGLQLVVQGKVLGHVTACLLHNLERLVDNSGSVDPNFGVPVHLWWNTDEVPRRGDLICLLLGLRTFVYLRPQGKCYRLVGRHELFQNWIQSGKFSFYGLLAWRGFHQDPDHYKFANDVPDPTTLEHAQACAEVEFTIV